MNCQDISRILNDDNIAALNLAAASSAREHLASCEECAGDWKIHEQMLAMPMPAPDPRLLVWRPSNRGVNAAGPLRRPLRNSLIVGALIAVGAAAAVFVVAGRLESLRTAESPTTQPTSNDALAPDGPFGTSEDSSAVSTELPNPSVTRALRPGYPYAFTAVLAPPRHEQQDELTVSAIEYLQAALLDKLRSIPHLILIEPESFDQYLRPTGLPIWPLPEGIDFLVQLHRRSPSSGGVDIETLTGQRSIQIYVLNAGDNRIAGGQTSNASGLPASIEEARDAADYLFETLLSKTFPPEDLSRLGEMRNTALDSTRLEQDRFAALDELELFPLRFRVFDESVQRQVAHSIALTATEIVSNSPDLAVRYRLWEVVSGLNDPYLVAPLAESLRRDSSDAVRLEAAKRLALDYGADPGARVALDAAALNDSSRSVRNYARWANTGESDRQALLAEMLSDPAVPHAERFAAVRSDIPNYLGYVTRTSAELLLGIAAAAPENMSWSNIPSDLGNAPSGEVVPLLLERLRDDPDAAVRRVAAGALLGHQDEPGVVNALRYARDNDPSPEVRLAAFTVR